MHENGFGSIESSDWLLLSCAVLFSFQIIAVDHFSPQVDGVRLSLAEFLVVSVESTIAAFVFEAPTTAQFAENALPISTAASCPVAWPTPCRSWASGT